MPITLQDEHITKLAHFIADYFVKNLHSDHVVPGTFIDEFDQSTRIFKGQISQKAAELWQNRNQTEQTSKELRDAFLLLRSVDQSAPEEKLKSLLPEEKIICNKQIFNNILTNEAFHNLTQAKEKFLLNQLKTESIGLNEQEIYIYYNLIKLNKGVNEATASEEASTPVETEDKIEQIMDNITTHFASLESITSLNENKTISEETVISALKNRFSTGKAKLPVMYLLSGSCDNRMEIVQTAKGFLSLVANKWGTPLEETFSYYTAYLLLYGCSDDFLSEKGISRFMINFLGGKGTKIKPIIQASIQFAYILTTVMVTQLIEINKKYHAANEGQKAKILKLYEAKDRKLLIVRNASQFAFNRVEAQKSEKMDTAKNYQMFIGKNPGIISNELLFGSDFSTL